MMADPGQRCKITMDCTDFHIQEPAPFNPKWYSHKFKGPGLEYKIGVCGGLFGSMGHSPQVAHSGINHHLDDHECYVGDRGYHNGQQWAEMSTGHNNPE